MTEVQKKLEQIEETKRNALNQSFGSLTYFYETIYLVIKNEHMTQQAAQPGFERKLEAIAFYKSKIENYLDHIGLDGKEWIADIASDYFEDYVHYREASLSIPDEIFYANLKRLNNIDSTCA
jgi:hypothetical protein